jgi:hypothetical protein
MADRTSACIRIGGSIAACDLPQLIAAIIDEDVGDSYDSGFDDDAAIEDFIHRAVAEGTPLTLMANEVVGGEFADLENTCRTLSLAYSRGDDGHFTWTPTLVFWEPGMPEPREWTGSVDNHTPHLDHATIRTLVTAFGLGEELALMQRADEFKIPLCLTEA